METSITIVAQDALSLITKAEIDTQVSTAKAFPRSLKMFLDKAMSMATVSDSVAASCSYALPRGGKTLEGPTVRLAEIACASYGNIRSGARVIANDGKTITAQGICHDLETNNCVTVEVKRKITDREGRTYNEDMQTVTGNAACAIAFRNAVFKVIPAALITDVYDAAKQVARGTAETLPERRDKALSYLKGLGVKEKQICTVLEIKRVEDIDLDKLATLRGMVALIKNGESTIKDLFEVKVEPATKAEKELERVSLLIKDCKEPTDLEKLKKDVPASLMEEWNIKMETLINPKSEQTLPL